MEKHISRRNFLKGALVTGASAAVTATALGGCVPQERSQAAANGDATSSKQWSWTVKPSPVPDSDIVEVLDTEICIIGAGATGVPAALAAAHSGADCIVMQKTDRITTNGWSAAAFGSKRFLEAGQTYDLVQIYKDFAELANGRDNGRVVQLFLHRSGEVMDYILDHTTEKTPVLLPSGHTFGWYVNNDMATRYTQFRELLELMGQKAEAAGARFLWETPAVQLVQDDTGDVTGVIGQRKNGSYVKINASKGVIMATGDLSDDPEMLECYAPLLVGVQSMHGAPVNTGDGFKMAMWAGASMDSAPHCIMMHFDPTWLPEGGAPFSGIPWLRVNLRGERFANENLGYQSVVTSVRLQPEQYAFQICDSRWAEHVHDYKHPNSHSRSTADPAHDWQDAIKRGAIVQADTIEELADAYGIDKAALVKTVERYNELVAKGVDEDFGVRSDYFGWNGITEAPFFIIKRAPGVLATVSGLTVNEQLQVLDTNGSPLPGLYAGGDASGSYYGNDYPLFITGGSLGRAFCFGVLAVRSALGKLDEPVTGLGR
jgi:fumarate reductase flavoprotein subunit